ncbi:MAG TPA: hypothetical protein PK843_00240 [bacterium]|nr:hypothetical protein [bacterium]
MNPRNGKRKPRMRQAEAAELIKAIAETSLDARQKAEGWGAAVITRLAQELKNELPELKGFSE